MGLEILLILIIAVAGMIVQGRLQRVFAKYSKVMFHGGLSALVPIVQFSSMFAQIVIILGLIMMNVFPSLYWIGIAMFFMIFLFSAITLPVEYNASSRALAWLERSNTLSTVELEQAKTTLSWAARTYLVAALSALASLIYYLGFRSND